MKSNEWESVLLIHRWKRKRLLNIKSTVTWKWLGITTQLIVTLAVCSFQGENTMASNHRLLIEMPFTIDIENFLRRNKRLFSGISRDLVELHACSNQKTFKAQIWTFLLSEIKLYSLESRKNRFIDDNYCGTDGRCINCYCDWSICTEREEYMSLEKE